MVRRYTSAHDLVMSFFKGPVTRSVRRRYGKSNGRDHRHQGPKECARRVRQRNNGTHGL